MLFSIAFIFWRAFIKRKWLKNKKLNGMALSILFLHACVCYVHSVILSHKKAFYAKPATMKYLRLLFVLFLLPASVLAARKPVVEHVHPTCWWSGMHHKQLQVLLHGPQLAACKVTVNGNGLVVDSVVRPSGGNYLLLYLNVEHAAPQTFHIALAQGKQRTVVPYTLHSREVVQRHTFGPADVVYLLMPDRFANALPGNDRVPGLRDQQASQEPDARHGGDLEGMRRGLDYLADLGVTAVWPTPLLVNDMPATTYHGYAITDYYEIDPRYGSNADYRRFVAEAHDKGIKVLQDMVFNHCGSYNFLFADRPDGTWFNNHSVYEQTRYKLAALTDPHAVQADAHNATDGWFVECMPDLNQRNPHVMTYLTQNSIWWIEYAHIDGIRQDTYPYADRQAMARWCQAVQAEYPGFNIVGETWINSNVAVSMWQKDSPLVPADRNAMLPTVMDFPLNGLLCSALDEATNEWDRGLARIYEYLSQDAVYADPSHLLTFLANHDTPRFARNEGEARNEARYRQALALLLTLRGTPQLYYGDELAMYGDKSHGDGALRQNFPGGFAGDSINAFTGQGLTPLMQRTHHFTRRLLQWRRQHPALTTAPLRHYSLQGTTYVYSRSAEGSTVTVVLNGADHEVSIPLSRYAASLPATTAYDVANDCQRDLGSGTLTLPARGVAILSF